MGFDALAGVAGDALFGGAADAAIGGAAIGGVSDAIVGSSAADLIGGVATETAASGAATGAAGGALSTAGSIASGASAISKGITAGTDIAKGLGGLATAGSLANPSLPHVDPITQGNLINGTPAAGVTPITGASGQLSTPYSSATTPGAVSYQPVATGQRPGDMSVQQLMASADPFVQQRATYGNLLNQLWNDPSQLEKSPGYQAGLTAVQRSEAAQGYGSSGHMADALLQYGGSIFDKEINTLAGLADVAPQNALGAANLGASYQLDQQHQAAQAAEQAQSLGAASQQSASAQAAAAALQAQNLTYNQNQHSADLSQQTQQFNAQEQQQLNEYNQSLYQAAQLANQSMEQQTKTTNAQIQSGLGISGAQLQQVGQTNSAQLIGQSLNSLASGASAYFK